MNAYLAEIIANERIAELRREADAMRLAARVSHQDRRPDPAQLEHIRRSLTRAVANLRRRSAPVASL